MKIRFICKNEGGNKYRDEIDYQRCNDCHFLFAQKGEHYSDDVVRCICPIKVKEGDKIEVIDIVRIVPKRKKRVFKKSPDKLVY